MSRDPFRAAPRDRVLTLLELHRDEAVIPGHAIERDLALLGAREDLELERGTVSLGVAVTDLLEADERYRDLETRGRDALEPLDEVPRGVSLERLLDDERERAFGELDRLVESIAAALPL